VAMRPGWDRTNLNPPALVQGAAGEPQVGASRAENRPETNAGLSPEGQFGSNLPITPLMASAEVQ